MKLVWTPEAVQDRDDIYRFIEQDDPLAAVTLDELISEKAALLVDHPHSGRIGRVPGTRELIVHPNYRLVYDVAGDWVRLLAVVHTARQWPPGSESNS